MNCKNCGAPLNETDKFCQNCGMVVNTPGTMENNQNNMETAATPNVMPNIMENQTIKAQPMPNENVDVLNAQSVPLQETVSNLNGINEQAGNTMDSFQQQTVSQMTQETTNPFGTMNNTQMPTGGNMDPFQSMNNNNTNNFNYQPISTNKKNSNMIVIIMGVVIVVLLGIVIFLALNTNKTQETKNTNNNNNGQVTTPTNVKNTTKVSYNGYTLEIPSEYEHESDETYLLLGTDEKMMYFYIVPNARLSQIDLNGTKTNLEDMGAEVVNTKKEQYNDVNMVIFEIEMSGEKGIIAFADFADNAVVQVTYRNISNEFDYETLKNDIAPMIKSAKRQTASNSIAQNSKWKDQKSIFKKTK